jgi:hypothetical protein
MFDRHFKVWPRSAATNFRGIYRFPIDYYLDRLLPSSAEPHTGATA